MTAAVRILIAAYFLSVAADALAQSPQRNGAVDAPFYTGVSDSPVFRLPSRHGWRGLDPATVRYVTRDLRDGQFAGVDKPEETRVPLCRTSIAI
jgi:hypothetical protein